MKTHIKMRPLCILSLGSTQDKLAEGGKRMETTRNLVIETDYAYL